MMKLATIILNLICGNYILYFYDKGKDKAETDYLLFVSFSITAVILLLLVLRWIKPKSSLIKTSLLAIAISFLVPTLAWTGIGLFVAEFSFDSLLKGLVMGSMIGVLSWRLSLPITILNMVLFATIARLSISKNDQI